MENIWTFLISDIWNFHLAIMGVLVSMITLLYASLCGKVEELNSIRQSKEYSLMNRATAMRNSIERLRKLNKQVIIGVLISFCLFVLTTIIKYMPESYMTKWIATSIAIITIGLLAYCIKVAYGVYSQYQTETF